MLGFLKAHRDLSHAEVLPGEWEDCVVGCLAGVCLAILVNIKIHSYLCLVGGRKGFFGLALLVPWA